MDTQVSQATALEASTVATPDFVVSQDVVAASVADTLTDAESQLTIAENPDPIAVITPAPGISVGRNHSGA